jgi:hypothetical protein
MITPVRIAFGIASADRETLASLISLFEETSLPSLLFDSAKDLVNSMSDLFSNTRENDKKKHKRSFEERLQEKQKSVVKEKVSTENLRLRLWMHLRKALDLEPAITFSNAGIESVTGSFEDKIIEIAYAMAETDELSKQSFFSQKYWTTRKDIALRYFKDNKRKPLSLANIVVQNVFRLLVEAERTDNIPAEVKAKILKKVKKKISVADSDLQKSLLKGGKVEDLTEDAALELLAVGGSLVSVGIAVELAGFSAYILAAQASAIIPFVGGQTLVSTLAVLANPFFIAPVILGGGVILSGSVKKKILHSFGVSVVSILILRAITDQKQDAEELIGAFQKMPWYLGKTVNQEYRKMKNKEKSGQMVDKMSRALKKVSLSLKEQLVTDRYPGFSKYLDQYYGLKGKTV